MIGRMTLESFHLGQGTGPLRGIKVVEIAGIGPGPHACTILADLGADVIRIERPGGQLLTGGSHDLLNRGRPSVALNLKDPAAAEVILDLVAGADVLVEGMRPGSRRAARHRTRRVPRPQPAAGLRPDDRLGPGRPVEPGGRPRHELHRDHRHPARPGPGQGEAAVPGEPGRRLRRRIDVPRHRHPGRPARGEGLRRGPGRRRRDRRRHRAPQHHAGRVPRRRDVQRERVSNLLDGGAPFYDIYETADGEHMSVGALEPQFFAAVRRAARHQGPGCPASSSSTGSTRCGT